LHCEEKLLKTERTYLDEPEDWPDDYLDYEEKPPTQEQLDHAKSIVGKYCISKSDLTLTPFLTNLLCKVTRVNDNARGENSTQVRIRVYRCGQMWGFGTWYLIGTSYGDVDQAVDSGWLIPTEERPSFSDRINCVFSTLARMTTSQISQEHQAFHYKWWYRDPIWPYLSPITSLLSALVDFVDSFRYGVYLNGRRKIRF
jgi:hypothetical protein